MRGKYFENYARVFSVYVVVVLKKRKKIRKSQFFRFIAVIKELNEQKTGFRGDFFVLGGKGMGTWGGF